MNDLKFFTQILIFSQIYIFTTLSLRLVFNDEINSCDKNYENISIGTILSFGFISISLCFIHNKIKCCINILFVSILINLFFSFFHIIMFFNIEIKIQECDVKVIIINAIFSFPAGIIISILISFLLYCFINIIGDFLDKNKKTKIFLHISWLISQVVMTSLYITHLNILGVILTHFFLSFLLLLKNKSFIIFLTILNGLFNFIFDYIVNHKPSIPTINSFFISIIILLYVINNLIINKKTETTIELTTIPPAIYASGFIEV